MRKGLLLLVFIFSTSLLVNANEVKENIFYDEDRESCYDFAADIAGIYAIYENLSFEEEDELFNELLSACFEANY